MNRRAYIYRKNKTVMTATTQMKMHGSANKTRESQTNISTQTLPRRICFSIAQTPINLFNPVQIWTFRL